MNKIFAPFLPPWVETGLQPAFYDMESGTVLQQTARMYAKVQQLTRLFNELSEETKNEIETFETNVDDRVTEFETNVDDRVTKFENSVNATVQDYIDKFTALKDFVEDYFDNLDVQKEINNKLDDMAEDGTLADIISQYLNSTAIFGYDNVASMKSSVNLIAGSYAHTMGYYERNDGGEALYKIREITNDDVVDEMFIIEMGDGSNNLVAELICTNKVNICQVGGQQNTGHVINTLIGMGKSIYIPAKDFVLEEGIVLDHGDTNLICDGNISSNSVMTYFKIASSSNKLILNGSVTGWQLNGVNAPVLIEVGSDSKFTEYNTVFVKNATVFAKGFYTQPNNQKGVSYLNATFSHIEALTGIHISCGDNGRNYVNENTFNGGRLTSDYGIVFTKGANQTDSYNGNVFNNIAVEKGNIIQCIDLNFASFNHFNNMRISEGLAQSEHPIHIGAGCRENIIQTKYQLKPNQIFDENTGNIERNYFKCGLVLNDGTRVGSNFFTYKGKEIITLDDAYHTSMQSIISTDDTNASTTEQLTDNGTLMCNGITLKVNVSYSGVTKTLKLPKGMDRYSITSFYVVFVYKENNSDVIIQDYDGNNIVEAGRFPSAKLQRKMYEVRFTNRAATSNMKDWSIIELQ